MDAAKQTLETKLTQLQITRDKTKPIGQSGIKSRIERQKDTLQVLGNAAEEAKRKLEDKKIAAGEELLDITTWCDEVESKITAVDEDISYLSSCLCEVEQAELDKNRKQQLQFEKELLAQKFHYKELELKQATEANQQPSQVRDKGSTAKLPKLSITKFNGTHLAWRRFWSQFVEEIDKSGMAPITKFSYLKEFVVPKVRKSIDGLPFTAEGYNRAKSVLDDCYSKESEIVKAYVRDIIELPTIAVAEPVQVRQFYERLVYDVQSLETMGKLEQVNGNVHLTIDKLSGIRGDLVRNDDKWQDWDFVKLCDALRSWTRRNPVEEQDKNSRKRERTRAYSTRQRDVKDKGRTCVYCDEATHRRIECQRVSLPNERKMILAEKRLCFNCTGTKHRASECNSKTTCQNCSKRHHTSICEESKPKGEKLLSVPDDDKVIHPVVIVNVDGIECRALIDSGAASSYASAKLLDKLGKKPIDVKYKKVEMLMATTTTRMEIHKATIASKAGDYQLEVNLIKVNKANLLEVENPQYEQLINSYPHLNGVKIDDLDSKSHLPVHLVLGAGVYAKIKMDSRPHVGKQGEPVAERTKLG